MSGRHLAFPFRIAADGRTATPETVAEHIKGEVIQLLLTSPGERPMMPTFGGGLRRLIFEGNSDVTAGLAKATISQALSHWLGHRIEVRTVEVESDESTLTIGLEYEIVSTGEQQALSFQHES